MLESCNLLFSISGQIGKNNETSQQSLVLLGTTNLYLDKAY